MTTRRRWLQFSLRTFFVLLTALAVWLGIVVNRAHEQRDAISEIHAMGGSIRYDWDGASMPGGPVWLRRLIGDDFFQDVVTVWLLRTPPAAELEITRSIPYLRRLRGLETVNIASSVAEDTQNELKAALPNCKVNLIQLREPQIDIDLAE